MKNLVIVILVAIPILFAFAEEKEEKKYTESQLREEVNKRVDEQINRLKKKSLTTLTKEILDKERKLDARERDLARREEVLKLSEKTLAQQSNAFNEEKQKILGCISENEKKETMRISQLVKVISGMKPTKAAELLSVQESNISVKILERIDPVKASKIFNSMEKEVSARLQKQYLNMKQ